MIEAILRDVGYLKPFSSLYRERTFAWLNRFCRLRVRYERRDDIHMAFTKLVCTLITFGVVAGFC